MLNKTLMNPSSEHKIKYIDIFRKLCYDVFPNVTLEDHIELMQND